ncbi:MAG TPA: YtxH domain-containing protein [Gemmatimonadaceae bacterium]|nr:YtxH domain-containing protein [Gemmatimonadaceae bacterium]
MRDYDFEDEPYVVIEREEGSVGSFLLGAALGAGLALLFAPRSGAETRRELGRSARRVGNAAADAASGVRENVSGAFQQARATVEDRIDAARDVVERKKRQVAEAMEAGREAARQARDDLERRIAETKAAYTAGADVARSARRERMRTRAESAPPGVGLDGDEDLSGG